MTQRNIGELFMDTLNADVIFVVDNQEIPGHRLALTEKCHSFKKHLFGDFLESNSKKVEITGMSAKVFKEVMRFVYKEQLEVEEWTIKDSMSLLAVAHEYEFQPLFSAVIRAVEVQPLDFDSWPLVNSAASVYDSDELRRKCSSFAEEKIEEFIFERHLEKFTAEFICCMLDSPKMSSFNQNHVVRAICNWRKGRSPSEITSVMQKIFWNKVSPDITAVIVKEFFSTVKNVEEYKFWTKLSADIQGPLENNALNDCIIRVDSLVLTKKMKMEFALPKNEGNLFCLLDSGLLQFWFQCDDSLVDISVKRIEFETETKFNVERISGINEECNFSDMVASEPLANNGWFKYTAVYSDAKLVSGIWSFSQHFDNISDIRLRNIVIY